MQEGTMRFRIPKLPHTSEETSELVRQIQAAKTVHDLPEAAVFLVREIGQKRKINRRTGMTERIITIKFSGRGLPAFRYKAPD